MRHVLRVGAIAFALAALGFAMCTAQRNARNSVLPATKAGPVYTPQAAPQSQAPQTIKKPAPRLDTYVLPASKAGPVYTPPPPQEATQQAGPR